jgi:hypothetical protein
MEADGMTEKEQTITKEEQTTDELSTKTESSFNDIDRNRALRDVRTIWDLP